LNLLTKAFVVVVTILAVILVALVVPFAAQVPDYAQQYQDMVKERDAQLAVSALEIKEVRNRMVSVEAQLTALGTENRDLGAEAEQLRNDKVALEGQLARANSTLAQVTDANAITVQVSERKDSQIASLTQRVTALTETLGQLNNSNNQLDQQIINVRSENRRLTDNYRRIQEQLQALETELAEARDRNAQLLQQAADRGYDPDANSGTVLVPVGVQIQGAVVQVEQLGDGTTHVLVNVGTRDQVRQGMKFQVSRGDRFICNVDILSTDIDESVGSVSLGGGVQPGDTIVAVNH